MASSRARRGQNEGSIYQRKDGRWVARLPLGYEGGRRRRKDYYGRTRREVQEKLNRGLADLHRGVMPSRDERLTVSAFLESWIRDNVAPSVRPSTLRTYEYIVRVHLVPTLGRTPLVRLSPQDVQRVVNEKARSGLSPRSVSHVRAVLRAALNDAMKWDLVVRNVAVNVDLPRIPRYEVQALAPGDARAVLAAVGNDRLGPLYAVTLALGLRQGEALGLSWADVDFDGRVVRIRRALQKIGGHWQLVEPKTERSRRKLPLPEPTVAELRRWHAHQLVERLAAGSEWQETGLVFTTSLGRPLDGPNVTHHLKKLLQLAGLPTMRFHDLRHGLATLMLSQGESPRVVMETLGHSQISLTLNTYTHVIPSLQREAADRVGAVLAGPPGREVRAVDRPGGARALVEH